MTERTIGVGIIGLGFMGRTHIAAWQQIRDEGGACRITAVCDRKPERFSGVIPVGGNLGEASEESLFDPGEVRGHATPDALLADPNVDAVSICTRTDSHVDLAVAALRAGKHVLVEKPVAVTAGEVQRLAEVSRATPGCVCMPAMCVRFWPGWDWLVEAIRDGRYGAVRGAVFRRLATPPGWSAAFYRDHEKSGGALVDLHIHDADFVRACFGDPDAVTAAGDLDHVTTLYHYESGPSHVVAEGGWDHAPGFPFRMRYIVNFAEATADYDLGRDEPLVLYRDGESESLDVPKDDGYVREIREFLAAIKSGDQPSPTMDEALATARLLDAERTSLETSSRVRLKG